MKFGVIVFPGSNCDHDAMFAGSLVSGNQSVTLWHKDSSIPKDVDCVIVPGGFSYGDYLRCGAIARFSPIMDQVAEFADKGGKVIGICNGFQILTEAGLLPGTLLRNNTLNFICKDVVLKVENNNTPFTSEFNTGDLITIPIAHGEGNYYADQQTISDLENNNQVIFRYSDSNGNANQNANPNGSINNIAGIANQKFNVLGMMPHPERYSDSLVGGSDGLGVFKSILKNFS